MKVWEGVIDEIYDCAVERSGSYEGILTVTHRPTGKTILTKGVTLSYNAIFGPDVSDVNAWAEMSIDAIDAGKHD